MRIKRSRVSFVDYEFYKVSNFFIKKFPDWCSFGYGELLGGIYVWFSYVMIALLLETITGILPCFQQHPFIPKTFEVIKIIILDAGLILVVVNVILKYLPKRYKQIEVLLNHEKKDRTASNIAIGFILIIGLLTPCFLLILFICRK